MIFQGKSIQSVADETIFPFLNNLLQSGDEAVVCDTLNNIKNLAGMGIERKNFLGLQRVLYHGNINIARSSLDILREMSPGIIRGAELKNDVLISMYPFFCDQALSTPDVAIDSLKILDTLIDYGIVGDYKTLQKALMHKNDAAAHLALDVLRKIKLSAKETRLERIKPVGAEIIRERVEKMQPVYQQIKEKPLEEPVQRKDELQSRIIEVLKKNPKYVESIKEVKSKYKR
jgi:hypothetical protein